LLEKAVGRIRRPGGGRKKAEQRAPALVRDLERLVELQTMATLTSARLREHYGRAGRQRAERYRWETCARQSLVFFNRVYLAGR